MTAVSATDSAPVVHGPGRVAALTGIRAVAATLPPPSEQDLLLARRLIMQGPPAEAVGLDPSPLAGPPTAAGRRAGPIDLLLTPNPRTPAGKAL